MKNKRENNNMTPYTRIIDGELSTILVENHNANVQAHLGTAQKLSSTIDFGALPEGSTIRDYTGAITASYQTSVNEVDLRINGGLQTVKGQAHIDNSKEDIEKIDREIDKAAKKLAPLKGKHDDSAKRFAPVYKRYMYGIVPLTAIIAGIELIANFEIFTMLGGGLISNIGIAILAGICIYWYGHFTPSKVKKYGRGIPRRELLIFFCYFIPLAVLFYFLSAMRINYLVALNPDMEEVFVSSPLVFTLMNCFAYLIICWLIIAYHPGRDVINAYKNYKAEVREINKLDAEKTALEDQKAQINPELRSKLTDHYDILLLGKQKEKEVVGYMHQCFNEFKLELLMRTNGACAKLFSGDIQQDLPGLELNYQHVEPKIPTQ